MTPGNGKEREDDKSIREIEMYTLQSTGFETKGFEDGHSFFV